MTDFTSCQTVYESEQEQLKQEMKALNAELNEADTKTTNVTKLIAVTKKYTRIDELTPEILNAFVDKIVVHEREKKSTECVLKQPKSRQRQEKSMLLPVHI